MAKLLTRLRIDEVSSVDRGAGEGVKIMLMKRNGNVANKFGSMFSKIFGGGEDNTVIIDKSVHGLAESVTSILSDDNVEDTAKAAALSKTFEQFGDHLKSTLTVGSTVVKTGESEMDLKALAKAFGLPETATEAEVTTAIGKSVAINKAAADAVVEMKKMQRELRVAKAEFTAAELDYYNKASEYDEEEDDSDPKLTADDKAGKKRKKAFREATHAQRADILKAAAPALPPEIQQILDQNKAMAKRIEDLESGGSMAVLTKRATELGLAESEAETLAKVRKGDLAAIEKLEGYLKSATAQAKAGGLFKEFGSRIGDSLGGTTAQDELNELAKKRLAAEPALGTFAKAFAKVYEDPANAEIVKRERTENRPQVA